MPLIAVQFSLRVSLPAPVCVFVLPPVVIPDSLALDDISLLFKA